MKTYLLKKLPILLMFGLGGCAQQRISAFMNSDAGKAIIGIVTNAGTQAIDELASTGKVNGKQIAADALSGASAAVRAKQTPGTALSAPQAEEAAKTAVQEGTGTPAVANKVAPVIASAVAQAVQNGHPADLVLEAAALGLDKAAASVK
jgi:hypothetical protein